MRGEYLSEAVRSDHRKELPPRARRILDDCEKFGVTNGTTSACAENTLRTLSTRESCWNYLRVRGEYGYPNNTKYARVELPPRARRIRLPE